jgi:Cd2+/Zn2+-exporting ATPase
VADRFGAERGYAVICLEDELRSTASQNLEVLRSLGVTDISVVSGDTRGAVEAVATRVGATRFFAETLPADKERIVAEAASKAPTMMVGDGVNDAPALARADVGVAMGGLGSDIAMNAADVVLMNDRLELIATLIKLGRKTKAIVRANLIFGGVVIGVLTLGATLGVLPLPLAVIGHEGSTLLVILNGLRLLGGVRSES